MNPTFRLPTHYIAIAYPKGQGFWCGCQQFFKTLDAYEDHLTPQTLFS